MGKKTVMAVFGTRPEAIKMCPVTEELKKWEAFDCRICVTGQHRELLYDALDAFGVIPDYDLALMQDGQSLFDITTGVLSALPPVLCTEAPDLVLVHGDTTSAFATALSCFYMGIPVAHVEAGLRTYDLHAPFPEEWNRLAVDRLSTLHFAPTEQAKKRLLQEGAHRERVFVTGNTVLDALRYTVREDYTDANLAWAADSRLILVTAHRRESFGTPLAQMLLGLRHIAESFSDVKILYTIHPNPAVGEVAKRILEDCPRVRMIPSLHVGDFHNILARAYLVVTDSGGVQEEAAGLGVPVLIMRQKTERSEGLEAGVARLCGISEGSVFRGVGELLENDALYYAMAHAVNPYGDGHAAERIVSRIAAYFSE